MAAYPHNVSKNWFAQQTINNECVSVSVCEFNCNMCDLFNVNNLINSLCMRIALDGLDEFFVA